MDKIIISQLQTEAIIGVYTQERQNPQPLLLDIELEFDTTLAIKNDHLPQTIDYAAVCNATRTFITSTDFQLLESLAEETAQKLLNLFKMYRCKITIYKKPFDIPNIQYVGVQITRERNCKHSRVDI